MLRTTGTTETYFAAKLPSFSFKRLMVPSHLKALPSAKESRVEWTHWGPRIFLLSLAHKIAASFVSTEEGKERGGGGGGGRGGGVQNKNILY